jgi:dihydroorotate dehydrogenase
MDLTRARSEGLEELFSSFGKLLQVTCSVFSLTRTHGAVPEQEVYRMAAVIARSISLQATGCPALRSACNSSLQSRSVRQYSQLLSSTRQPIQSLNTGNNAGSLISHRNLFTRRKPRPFYKAFVYTLLAFGATYHLESRSAVHRWIAIPVLQTVTDPETAQKLAIKLLSTGIMPRDMVSDDEVLSAEVSV